ncbi:hypothetical protein AGMMS49975_12810 [Clostridia bacterium]|nr:hypothetical protein AGMMS49975_12810 [Clostridia bacterium]
MTKKKKLIIAGSIVVLIILLVVMSTLNERRAEKASGIPKNAFPVEIQDAATDTIVSKVSVTGTVDVVNETQMFPSVSATVEQVFVKQGDKVNAGDLILKYKEDSLDDYRSQMSDLELQLDAAKLSLQQLSIPPSEVEVLAAKNEIRTAESAITDTTAQIEKAQENIGTLEETLSKANNKYNEMKQLYDAGALSKNDFDVYGDDVTKAKNDLRSGNLSKESLVRSLSDLEDTLEFNKKKYDAMINPANDENVKNSLERARINASQIQLKIDELQKKIDTFVYDETAKTGGTIISLDVHEGELADKNTPLLTIADTDAGNLKITASIPEADAANVKVGAEATITGTALGTASVKGNVTKIYPYAETTTINQVTEKVVRAEIPFDNKIGLIVGNTVDVDIITRIYEDAVVVPITATFSENGGKDFVYIMKEDYSVEKREITLLDYTGLNIGVTGVNAGEKVVVTTSPQVREGTYVRPITPTKAR